MRFAMAIIAGAVSTLLAGGANALPTGGAVKLTASPSLCPPVGNCASSTTSTSFSTIFGGNSLFMSGSASANQIAGFINNAIVGASPHVIVDFIDHFTLHGPGSTPIAVTASLHGTGTRSNLINSVSMGFKSGFSYLSSFGFAPNAGPLIVDQTALHVFSVVPGVSFEVDINLDLLSLAAGILDFSSTATLGFTLPEGYYLTSEGGYSATGSLQTNAATEPTSLALLGAALAFAGFQRRRAPKSR